MTRQKLFDSIRLRKPSGESSLEHIQSTRIYLGRADGDDSSFGYITGYRRAFI